MAATAAPVAAADAKVHKLVVHVDSNNPATQNLALNNVENVNKYYKDKGEKVMIEVVAYGPGLHMLRSDTSKVKGRVETMSLAGPGVSGAMTSSTTLASASARTASTWSAGTQAHTGCGTQTTPTGVSSGSGSGRRRKVAPMPISSRQGSGPEVST